MRSVRIAGASLLTAMLVLSFAGGAMAATPEVIFKNDPLTFDPFIDTEECPGQSILSEGRGSRSRTLYFDSEGNETRLVIHVRYRLWFTDLDSGVTLTTAGTRHIELDFVNGTWTETGIYRNVTAPGEGAVLQVLGRSVEDLDTEELIKYSGPPDGQSEQYCSALAGEESTK